MGRDKRYWVRIALWFGAIVERLGERRHAAMRAFLVGRDEGARTY